MPLWLYSSVGRERRYDGTVPPKGVELASARRQADLANADRLAEHAARRARLARQAGQLGRADAHARDLMVIRHYGLSVLKDDPPTR